MRLEACRSCGAPVVWAKHYRTGKSAPMNAESSDDGGFVIVDEEGTTTYRPPWGDEGTLPRHTSHFATCPEGPAWRKARGGSS